MTKIDRQDAEGYAIHPDFTSARTPEDLDTILQASAGTVLDYLGDLVALYGPGVRLEVTVRVVGEEPVSTPRTMN